MSCESTGYPHIRTIEVVSSHPPALDLTESVNGGARFDTVAAPWNVKLGKTKSSELAFAAFWASYPPPGHSPNQTSLLVERQKGLASRFAGNSGAGGLHAHHRLFERAEAADTGLVDGDRRSRRVVGPGG